MARLPDVAAAGLPEPDPAAAPPRLPPLSPAEAMAAEDQRILAMYHRMGALLEARVARRDRPVDREAGEAAVRRFYAAMEWPVPLAVVFPAPGTVLDEALLTVARQGQEAEFGRRSIGEVMRRLGPPPPSRPTVITRLDRIRRDQVPRESGPPFRRQLRGWSNIVIQEFSSLDSRFPELTGLARASIGADEDVVGPFMMRLIEEAEPGSLQQIIPAANFGKFRELIDAVEAVTDQCGIIHCFHGFALVTGWPVVAHFDAEDRLHNEFGPALSFPSGNRHFLWHGVAVPEALVMAPETLTAASVRSEANTEIRRVMIERMGAENFVRASGAQEVHRDATGILWRVEFKREVRLSKLIAKLDLSPLTAAERELLTSRLADDPWRDTLEPSDIWQAVEVINATPEADGSRRRYFLAVPPDVSTARAAVAWTFGMTEAEYQPDTES